MLILDKSKQRFGDRRAGPAFDLASRLGYPDRLDTGWKRSDPGFGPRNRPWPLGSALSCIAAGRLAEIPLAINPDLPQLRARWKDAGKTISHTDISPSGKRAIITARGEVFTVPVEEGSSRNISVDGTTHEYTAIWSPGGDQLAYITESEGGQSLVLKDQSGMGEAWVYELAPYFYRLLAWGAGDDPRMVFQDNHLSLYAIGLPGGSISKIATGSRRENIEVSISGDGNWLEYTLEQENYNRDLVLLNFDSGTTTVVTDGTADIASPAFSRDGKYLYFAASTNSGPIQVGLNMSSQEKPYRAGLYALVLSADGNWSVENEGVAPDIEVALDPIASNQGRDTQLERAISQVLSQPEGFKSKIPTEAPALPTELGR